jgi:hypothetical protein
MTNEKEKYNPFNDRTIHSTLNEQVILSEDREGFNDVLKHNDHVNGFQVPKNLSSFPKRYRKIIRIYALLSVILFFLGILYGFIHQIRDLFK